MASTKEKTDAAEAAAERHYLGQASAEQVAAWKKAHGTLTLIKVKNTDGAVSACYLRPADRETASLAYTHMANKRLIDAGAVFLANCWLGGDERVRTEDRMYIAACQQAYECPDLAEASSEKL